jgi:hypothetical protein
MCGSYKKKPNQNSPFIICNEPPWKKTIDDSSITNSKDFTENKLCNLDKL